MPRCAWPSGCSNLAAVDLCRPHQKKLRDLRKWRGDFDLVDAGPAAAHLRVLRNRGWNWRQLQYATAQRHETMKATLDRATPLIKRHKAEQILAVRPLWQHTQVALPIVGSMRRLHGLGWQGHTYAFISTESGIPIDRLRHVSSSSSIFAVNAARIAGVADRYGYAPGPSMRARIRARALGALPLAAWPEDTIDDPDAVPDLSALRVDEPRRRIDLDEVAERLSYGAELADVAAALGFAEASVKEALKQRRRREQQEGAA
jgi:lambda repressor-like predicted transcriptional regulator